MRLLIHVKFPVEPFNTYVKDVSTGAKVQNNSLAPDRIGAVWFAGRVY